MKTSVLTLDICAGLAFSAGLVWFIFFSDDSSWPAVMARTSNAVVFVAGGAIYVLYKYIVKRSAEEKPHLRSDVRRNDDSKMYGLKHAVLNINTAETQMWMNMGYWKDQSVPRNFPHACESMLHEILFMAGLSKAPADLADKPMAPTVYQDSAVNIVDVGFGCGDQSLALSKLANPRSYVGITIDKKQFSFAEHRLRQCGFLSSTLR